MKQDENNERPTIRQIGRRVLETEAQAVAGLVDRLDEAFDRAVDVLDACSGRVVVTGMGKSGVICQKIAATLSSTGRPAFFMHPAEAIHGDLGMIVAGDVLLAVSNSGETEEVVRLLELVRRLGARIIALTGNPGSSLARFADVHLDVGVNREACTFDMVPTASTTAALAMGDALTIACYEKRGFTERDFVRYHPGGRLGRKLLQVHRLMHTGEQLPKIRKDASVAEAVEELSRKRLGMICVVDGDDRLLGIITDGDLRRRMLAVAEPLDGTAGQAMIHAPTTITAEALATEALNIMEERRITSLPVVDGDRQLVGVIQIHDLWRTELF